MKTHQKILGDILRLKNDLEKQNVRLPPGLAGMYGEFMVWEKLENYFAKKGFKVLYYSGQKGADIQLVKDDNSKHPTEINVEVKTSRLKEEGFGLWYGAALNIKKCGLVDHKSRSIVHNKKGKIIGDFCYFDYLVFVKLRDNFKNSQFYIFPRDLIWQHRELLLNTHKRFNSGTHRIILPNGKSHLKMPKSQLNLIKKMEKFKGKWSLIK